MTEVSVIIPCRNEEATIQKLLFSLFNQTLPQSLYEVVIADGMSTDKTLESIADFQNQHTNFNLKIVKNTKQNIPTGLNTAIQASQGKYIIRLDAHSIPNNDYLERCVNHLENQTADNVGGIWLIRPSDDTPIARAIALAASHPLGMGGANYRDVNAKAAYVDTVPFGAFTREILDQVGLFDETLLSNEDYELNTRIRKAGGRVYLDPAIQCIYFARKNLTQLSKQYWRYGFWKYKMLKRYPDTLRLRQALPPLFVLSLLTLILLSPFLPFFAYVFSLTVLIYLLSLLAGTFSATSKESNFVVIWLQSISAITTMHFSWGTAFLFSFFDSLFSKSK